MLTSVKCPKSVHDGRGVLSKSAAGACARFWRSVRIGVPYLLRILDLHPRRDRSRRILEAVGALGDDPFEVVSADLAKKCQTVAATCFVQMIVADCFGTTAPENRSSGSLYVGPVVGDRRKLEAQRLGKVPGRDELEGGLVNTTPRD